MWNPEKIRFKNLFSHKESEYEFNNNTCTVIAGDNQTDVGFDNNGAGKSTLVEGIAIALIGESVRDLDKEDFINEDEDFSEIDFFLRNDYLKMKLRIHRIFYRGSKSALIELFENGKQNLQVTSNTDANKRISALIGITKEDLLRYYIISQDSRYTFFTANDVDKKEVMNRITSANMINPLFFELNNRMSENKAISKDLNDELIGITSRRDTLAEQAEEEGNSAVNQEEIETLEEDIEEKAENLKKSMKSYDDRLKKNNALSILIKAKTAKLGDKTKLKTELSSVNSDIHESEEIIRKLAKELAGTVVCPECDTHFIPESEFGLSVEDTEETKTATETALALLEKNRDAIKAKLNKIRVEEDAIADLETDFKTESRSLANLLLDNESAKKRLTKSKERLEELKKPKETKRLKDLKLKIELLEKEIKAKELEIVEIDKKIEMISYWQYNLGKSGFMTYLANKSIKVIEGITNSFLRKFKTELTVQINGFKVLKSGAVREKIEVFLQKDGLKTKKFVANSGGERGRVNLAGILGINHLLNLSSSGRALNLVVLDEVFPGIDPKGQENIIKILENLGITIIMITQVVSSNFNNQNTLHVRKIGGISEYYNV